MKKKFTLHMGGKPCTPGKSRKFSPAGAKKLTEYINGIKFQGRIINKEEFDFNMEHIYYDDLINLNIAIENYEECARLLKIKNNLTQDEGKTILNIV
jgi:hypothetical protein